MLPDRSVPVRRTSLEDLGSPDVVDEHVHVPELGTQPLRESRNPCGVEMVDGDRDPVPADLADELGRLLDRLRTVVVRSQGTATTAAPGAHHGRAGFPERQCDPATSAAGGSRNNGHLPSECARIRCPAHRRDTASPAPLWVASGLMARDEVTLRPATADDIESIAPIWHQGWQDGHLGNVPDELTAARTGHSFWSRAEERLSDTTVAEVSGEVAGFVMVVQDEVEQVYVGEDHRGSGVAGLLLADGERQVKSKGTTPRGLPSWPETSARGASTPSVAGSTKASLTIRRPVPRAQSRFPRTVTSKPSDLSRDPSGALHTSATVRAPRAPTSASSPIGQP